MMVRITCYARDPVGRVLLREWRSVAIEEAGRIACNALLAHPGAFVVMAPEVA